MNLLSVLQTPDKAREIHRRLGHALQCQRQADGSAAWVVVRTRCGR